MKFDYDIFISYPDAGTIEDELSKIWAEKFCHYLSIVLDRIFSRKPVILLHDDLRSRKDLLSEGLENIFPKTAVFVILLTPDFEKSESYTNELEEINNAIKRNKNENPALPTEVYKILTYPVKEDTVPEYLRSERAYSFFEVNRYNKKPVIYDLNTDNPDDHFWAKLIDLAYDIHNSLEILLSSDNKKKNEPVASIYLAETTSDQDENRDIIKRELQHLDYRILPEMQLPNDALKLKPVIEQCLEKSILSIHIMGSFYGEYLKNSQYSLNDFQNRVIKEYIGERNDKLVRIIWIPNDLKSSDQRQNLYIKRLKRDEARKNTEIVEAPLEVLKTIIQTKLDEILNPAIIEKGDKDKIYFIAENIADEPVKDMVEYLESQQFEVLKLKPINTNHTFVHQHRKNLVDADAILIYQGKSNEYWLDSKIRDLIKTPGYGKNKPFKAIGIFTENNLEDVAGGFISGITLLENNRESSLALKPFTDKLNK
jgi:hypothetical protein